MKDERQRNGDVDASRYARSAGALALSDFTEGFKLWSLAVRLGWLDIKLRYRGSLLGPFWLTLSCLVMVVSMGTIYAHLFHVVLRTYLPFLALSLALWQVGLSNILLESCVCFVDARHNVLSVKTPFTVEILRLLTRNAVVFAHTIIVPLGVFLCFRIPISLGALWSLAGLLLWALDGFAACLLLGALCARFRDVPPIIGAFLQIAFYVTPVIWQPSQIGIQSHWLRLNPFYALMETVRAPIMGVEIDHAALLTALGVSFIWITLGIVVFMKTRARIAFWI